jgi:hypothetical protein
MAIDVPVNEFISTLNHDGSEILYPEDAEPYRRRGFHIQEMIDVCMLQNIAVVGIEKNPVSELQSGVYTLPVDKNRFEYYLVNYSGVLVGTGVRGTPHAVAWGRSKVYDPNGTVYSLPEFNAQQFFLTVKINITLF